MAAGRCWSCRPWWPSTWQHAADGPDGARTLAAQGLLVSGAGAATGLAPEPAVCVLRSRARPPGRGGRPTDGDRRDAAARGHGHPRHGRLQQHGEPRTSQPSRIGAAEAGCPRLRPRSAVVGQDRRGRLRPQCGDRADRPPSIIPPSCGPSTTCPWAAAPRWRPGSSPRSTHIAGKTLKVNGTALNEDNSNEVNIGYFGGATIVLFSDGEDTSQINPVTMARLASTAGVRIQTIGVGTVAGTTVQDRGIQRRHRAGSADARGRRQGHERRPTTKSTTGLRCATSRKTIDLHFTVVSRVHRDLGHLRRRGRAPPRRRRAALGVVVRAGDVR